MKGDYKAITDLRLRFAISSVGISKGCVVSVMQVDNTHKKVLIKIGRDIDWFHFSTLNSFIKV